MAFDNDPVGNGFVESLARPGGNMTGLSTLAPEISQKRLELLTEVVQHRPRLMAGGASKSVLAGERRKRVRSRIHAQDNDDEDQGKR